MHYSFINYHCFLQQENSLHKLHGTVGLKLLGTTGLEILGRVYVCIVDNQVIVPMSVLGRLPGLKGVKLVIVPMSCLGSLPSLEGIELVVYRVLLVSLYPGIPQGLNKMSQFWDCGL
jgi:hypothetical protein